MGATGADPQQAEATIVVATYGAEMWRRMALGRAVPSAKKQGYPVIHVHGDSLHEARNEGAEMALSEWLVFLDGDDTLSKGYVDALLDGSGDLRVPRLFFTDDDRDWEPFDLRERDMMEGNPCPIGTMIRKEMFIQCGGFKNWRAYEDFALFQRAWMLGAEIVHHDGAIYYSLDRLHSRNKAVDHPGTLVREIRKDNKEWLKYYYSS